MPEQTGLCVDFMLYRKHTVLPEKSGLGTLPPGTRAAPNPLTNLLQLAAKGILFVSRLAVLVKSRAVEPLARGAG